ncbi:MAG: TonB family protein [Deltaproteobacteria bacterium]|nr:TonB family protein [Deltaproteobacteria bacterium]
MLSLIRIAISMKNLCPGTPNGAEKILSMNSTIINKILPGSSLWSFFLPSLALHGFLGLILVQTALSPKPPFTERVIPIRIVEATEIREEKRVLSSVPKMKKIFSQFTEKELFPSFLPMEREFAQQTATPSKEEQSDVPTETLNSLRQDIIEQLPQPEGERNSAEIAESPAESTTAGQELKGFALTLAEKPGDGGLPAPQGKNWSESLESEGIGPFGSTGKSPEKKQTEESGSGQGEKMGSPGSGQGEKPESPSSGQGEKMGSPGSGQGEKTGSPGSPPGAGKGKGDLFTYLSAVRLKIDKVKKYPQEALRKNWEGTVVLAFQINWQGEVNGIKLIQSSGHPILDEEGKAILRRASPLPLPPLWEKESLELQIPILFSIDRKK